MRGWACYYRPASVAIRQEAQRFFERALEVDPGSVDGRIGLARVLVAYLADGWSSNFQEDVARAEQLLLEALERDANRSMAHEAMGMLRRAQNRLSDSQIELETAIALNRNEAQAIFQLGQTMMWLGHPEAAIPHIEKAIRLNPHDPNSANFHRMLGLCHLYLGRVDEAIHLLRKARAGNPRFWFAHLYLAGALGFRGDLDEARVALAEAIKLKPEVNSLARFGAQYPWITNPPYWALLEKTVNLGLRRAGFPEE
jgi:adenylate cyclase